MRQKQFVQQALKSFFIFIYAGGPIIKTLCLIFRDLFPKQTVFTSKIKINGEWKAKCLQSYWRQKQVPVMISQDCLYEAKDGAETGKAFLPHSVQTDGTK